MGGPARPLKSDRHDIRSTPISRDERDRIRFGVGFMSEGEDSMGSVLGAVLVMLIAVACVVALTAVLYLAVPPVRRFIRKDRPVWWVGDIFIAVVVALLVLVGQHYLVTANARD